jgi:poly(3-hydroxybutyrate) depolymerase
MVLREHSLLAGRPASPLMLTKHVARLGSVLLLLSLFSSMSLHALSSGCGKQVAAGALSIVKSTDGAGRGRTYIRLVPSNYDPHRGYSLVFVFHGAGGSATGSFELGLQNVPGAGESAIFVFPQGIPFQKEGVGWDDTNQGYDFPFFDNMVREIEAGYCIDTEEVFATGFSWGGDFSTALGCNRGDTLRAIVVNSASDEFHDTANYLTYEDLPCPSHRYPAVRFEHAAVADPAYPAPDFATTAKLFRYFNQCSAASAPAPEGGAVTSCVKFDGCSNEFMECSFDAHIGHTLPPDWAQNAWEFIASFRKSRPQ